MTLENWTTHEILPNEQVLELLRQYKQTKNIDFKNKIIQYNIRMIFSLAHNVHNKNPRISLMDAVSTGVLALSDAIERYQEEKGCLPSVWFWRYINGYQLNLLKDPELQHFSFQQMVNSETEDKFEDILKDESVVDSCQACIDIDETCLDRVTKAMKVLNPREKFVVVHYFGLEGKDPESFETIGKQINRTPNSVRYTLNVALEKMSDVVEKVA